MGSLPQPSPSDTNLVPRPEVGAAHDFKNLLFVIGVHTQRLLHALDAGDPRRRDVEAIAATAERALALSRQLLESGRGRVAPAPVLDTGLVLRGLEELLRCLCGPTVTVEMRMADGLWPLRVNGTQLEQVVTNLAVNARDAMPQGGLLSISAENRTIRDASGARDVVVVTVRDTGTGIAPDVQARMFEPYFTTKGAGGTGVGLATVRAIVADNGGHLEVESARDRGTAVSVVFPRAGEGRTAATAPARRPVMGTTRPRILLVDDEPGVRDLLAHCLELEGYEPIVAGTGEEALAIARRPDTLVDLLVTDMNLPDILGSDVAADLRQRDPGLGVVLISGDAAAASEQASGGPVLMKPFSLVDFKRTVRGALASRRVA